MGSLFVRVSMTALLSTAACGSKAPPPADVSPPTATTTAPTTTTSPAADAGGATATATAPEADAGAATSAAADAGEVKVTYYLGRLALPTGLPVKLLVKATGANEATIDIPMQHLEGAKLSDVVISDTSIAFSFLPPGAPPEAVSKFSATRAAGDEAYAGELTVGPTKMKVRFFPASGADALTAKRPQTPAPPFDYKTEEVKVAVDGAELGCTVSIPAAAANVKQDGEQKKVGGVVFLTGSGLQDRDEAIFDHKPFLVLGDALAKAGVASLRCDDRGAGSSTGKPDEVDAEVFAADAVKMLEALRARPEIDPAKVGLLGHSEGGMTAAAVAKKDDKVAFVVTVSGPGQTGRQILVRQNSDMILSQGVKKDSAEALTAAVDAYFGAIADGKAGDELAKSVKALAELVNANMEVEGPKPTVEDLTANFGKLAEMKWLKGFLAATPAEDLCASKAAVLALFGEKDVQVRADANAAAVKDACAKTAKTNVTIEIVPGANHLFQNAKTGEVAEYDEIEETMSPATVERITKWLAETTGVGK